MGVTVSVGNITKYYIPKSIVYLKIGYIDYVYNWDLGDYIEFNEKNDFLTSVIEGENIYSSRSFEDIEFLLENNYIFESKGLYSKWKDKIFLKEKRRIDRSINLILLPAEQACNFSCVYCYEDHSIRKKMGDKEFNSIVNYIEKECSKRKIDQVNISYFGGEPLMNKKFIKYFNTHVKELSNNNSFRFSSSMTTNGYLLDINTAKDYEKINIKSYQITLDGLKEEHNKLRPLVKGTGTYDRIIDNLLLIKSSDLDIVIDIRVNFNSMHMESSYKDKLITSFSQLFENDPRFRIRFRPIGDYASLNNRNVDSDVLCGKENMNKDQILFEKFALEKGMKLADINMFSDVGSYSCYAGKINHYIIDSKLKIKKCTVALDDELNDVGELLPSGEIMLNKNHDKWLASYTNDNCSSCAINIQCKGSACPLINMKNKKAICPPVTSYKKEWSERLVKFIQEK